tara:strand:+ start:560 stop:1357 length:798 start_codon:yes stop_codon:yes gene_type:complete
MDHIQTKSELIEQLIEISKEAGKAILEVYNTDFDHQIKEDLSPLTNADTLSHNIIYERLKVLTPDIPILSEENSDIPFGIRSTWNEYWLIDPLDGTKEFINKNDEFTVNIALVRKHKPILGLIYIPVIKHTYWGSEDFGSFFIDADNKIKKIEVSKKMDNCMKIAVSRSHPSKELNSFLINIKNFKLLKVGSSIKFCMIASGAADLYPRFGPTSEWDTAAGHAILKYAGGRIITLNKNELEYNKKDSYLNKSFIASPINLKIPNI